MSSSVTRAARPGDVGWWTPTRVAQLVAGALFAAAGLLIAFVPLATEVTETATPGGPVIETVRSTTIVHDIGWDGVIVLVTIPLVLALGPMFASGRWHRRLTILAAAVAGALCFLALASVGMLFLPGLLALVIGAVLVATGDRRAARGAQS